MMRSLPSPQVRWFAAAMLLLPACGTDKGSASGDDSTGSSAATDVDGDGYGGETDCDDSSALIYPGAEERCNNLDDNCDGQVDEDGVVDGVTAYLDEDGDGWGADLATTICPGVAGYLYSSGDCDDSAAGINPAATELCDSVDNDCDGLTDEPGTPDGTTYSLDQDGDGYGHPILTGTACAPGEGYVEDNSDCDDGDPDINPDACDALDEPDGVDNDCSGVPDDSDSCGNNTGIATYLYDDGSTSCTYRFDNVWNPISSMCDACLYGWDVSFDLDTGASTLDPGCDTTASMEWEFSFDEDYDGYGSVLWYYYVDYWVPVWLATLDDSGHLEWDATTSYYGYTYGWYGYADLDL